jgi:hypothetical protein
VSRRHHLAVDQARACLEAPGSSSDRKRSQPIRAFSATPTDGQRPCRALAEDPGRTQPSCGIPGAAAQTRVVSMAGIRLGSGESARAFKGIICDDISEFESDMPSHAVGLCRCVPCLPMSITGRRKIVATILAERLEQADETAQFMCRWPPLLFPFPNPVAPDLGCFVRRKHGLQTEPFNVYVEFQPSRSIWRAATKICGGFLDDSEASARARAK